MEEREGTLSRRPGCLILTQACSVRQNGQESLLIQSQVNQQRNEISMLGQATAFASVLGAARTDFRIFLLTAITLALTTTSSAMADAILTEISSAIQNSQGTATSSASYSDSVNGNIYSANAKAFASDSVTGAGIADATGTTTWAITLSVSDPNDPDNMEQVMLNFSGTLTGTLAAKETGLGASSAFVNTGIFINGEDVAPFYSQQVLAIALQSTSTSVSKGFAPTSVFVQDGSTFEIGGLLDAGANVQTALGVGSATSNFGHTLSYTVSATTLPEPSSLSMVLIALLLLSINYYVLVRRKSVVERPNLV